MRNKRGNIEGINEQVLYVYINCIKTFLNTKLELFISPNVLDLV